MKTSPVIPYYPRCFLISSSLMSGKRVPSKKKKKKSQLCWMKVFFLGFLKSFRSIQVFILAVGFLPVCSYGDGSGGCCCCSWWCWWCFFGVWFCFSRLKVFHFCTPLLTILRATATLYNLVDYFLKLHSTPPALISSVEEECDLSGSWHSPHLVLVTSTLEHRFLTQDIILLWGKESR